MYKRQAVIPTATAHLQFRSDAADVNADSRGIRQAITSGINWLIENTSHRIAIISIVIATSIGTFVYLTPAAEYLPEGEEPKTFASLSSPPGYNLETMSKIGRELQEYFLQFLDHTPEQFDNGETTVPAIAYLNLSIESKRIRIISQPKDPRHIKALMKAIGDKYQQYPAMRSFVTRGSIITSNSGGTRSVNLDISGPNLSDIYKSALTAYRRAQEVFDSPRIRANPSTLSLSQPLIEIVPKWTRASEVGMSTGDFGFTVAALTDGAFVDEFFLEDDKVDIYLYSKAGTNASLDSLSQMSVYTPIGAVVPLSLIHISEPTRH